MKNISAPERMIIATRESRLAMWQAQHVASRLSALYPACRIEIVGMTTKGDRIQDRPLSQVGGKGLFVKELEMALQDGRADLAVHSLKDVPMDLSPGFALTAILAREVPFDALVSNTYEGLDVLPAGTRVGTSSQRRAAVLRTKFPHLHIEPLRGNLDTRLRKLDEGRYDAIILAAAGLIRLGLKDRIKALLTPEQMLPAPGQGALGIEILSGRTDVAAWMAPLNDPETAPCVSAERAFSRAYGGSCHEALGGYAVIEKEELWLRGFVALSDGCRLASGERRGSPREAEVMGQQLAQQLREYVMGK